ncbi:MAG: peptide chain release factor N(5)-glutamine methyltransferase [Anaerolineaceae bacterium]|nr:peptide chain release factor N(5)-glutamine methyltransferase [Anaerolineaceae bacterium]
MTIREVLRTARKRIEPVSESAGLDVHILLGKVLGVERAYLLANPSHVLTEDQRHRFEALVERCAAGEPLPYILGRWAFYDREFIVTPAVLIPRPETELLLEQALVFVKSNPAATAIDIGTGSGALAVTLAVHCPAARVYAVDISPAALAVARCNAAENAVMERITFLEGDLLAPLLDNAVQGDVILANLPYIASDDLPGLTVTRYEPRLALDGGADGLDLMRRLLAQLPGVLRPGGLALLEIGADQGAAASELAQTALPQATVRVIQDYAGLDRIVAIQSP